jgi:hypothetical protein
VAHQWYTSGTLAGQWYTSGTPVVHQQANGTLMRKNHTVGPTHIWQQLSYSTIRTQQLQAHFQHRAFVCIMRAVIIGPPFPAMKKGKGQVALELVVGSRSHLACIRLPVLGCLYQVACVGYPVSGCLYQVACIRLPVSGSLCWVACIG